MSNATIDYTKTCFVIMPFGIKTVDKKEINFDTIYNTVFLPAISAVELPEGGKLIPKRTDKDYFSGNIDIEMFHYLEYSRFALVDITGLNANVFYELGIRHHVRSSGTAIFRQATTVIPFDISRIKAFPYEYEPDEQVAESIALIKNVLVESLQFNRIDSPVQVALKVQQNHGAFLDEILQQATNALRHNDEDVAIAKFARAIEIDPNNYLLHMKSGLVLKNKGRWKEAVDAFAHAAGLNPLSSDAWRELGVAENKFYTKAKVEQEQMANLRTGEQSIRKAIELDARDYDAYSSLGGILKRERKYAESEEMYRKAVEISSGHPYPLNNFLILLIREKGVDAITKVHRRFMERAEVPLTKKVNDDPPYDAPWCFFDLSTIKLLQGNTAEARDMLKKGLNYAQTWAVKTHLDTIGLMEGAQIGGLQEIIDELREEIEIRSAMERL
jgi:Tfp pilus assembly protein PilF